jgi:hypothetical protein
VGYVIFMDEGCYTHNKLFTPKSPHHDVECHIRIIFFFFSFSPSLSPLRLLPPSSLSLPPPATRSGPSSTREAGLSARKVSNPTQDPTVLVGKGPNLRPFRPRKGRIPASQLGFGRSGREMAESRLGNSWILSSRLTLSLSDTLCLRLHFQLPTEREKKKNEREEREREKERERELSF